MMERRDSSGRPPNGTSSRESRGPSNGRIRMEVEGDSDLLAYLHVVDCTPVMDAETERELGWFVANQGCSESKDRLVRGNLHLVVAIAKTYLGRGVEHEDLIVEGNIGLACAVESFDPAQGARFSTHASWWIKQAMRRLVREGQQGC